MKIKKEIVGTISVDTKVIFICHTMEHSFLKGVILAGRNLIKEY
jgi:hypothetical protein